MIDIDKLSKIYYSIGEVSELLGVAQSQLRYWESEFNQLKPGKNNRGERKYTKKEIAIIDEIQFLLKDRGFTVDGAKKELLQAKAEGKANQEVIKKLKTIKTKLLEIKNELEAHQ
jgi:DNA-binding transcriptional MerR regulator